MTYQDDKKIIFSVFSGTNRSFDKNKNK